MNHEDLLPLAEEIVRLMRRDHAESRRLAAASCPSFTALRPFDNLGFCRIIHRGRPRASHGKGGYVKTLIATTLGLVFGCCIFVTCANAATITALKAAIEGVYILDEWTIGGQTFRP
jgi:hypothetical protein